MLAAILKKSKKQLALEDVSKPVCGNNELLLKVEACALCRTDLHILDGELLQSKDSLILGHEIVGLIEEIGSDVSRFSVGQRVGVTWLAQSCGVCEYCKSSQENLCDDAQFTGFDRDGGFAEYTTCVADFAIPLSLDVKAEILSPFLCAGLIGYRSYQMAGPLRTLGIYGFGSAASLLLPFALSEGIGVYVFTKQNDEKKQQKALRHGASWVGDSTQKPPVMLDSAILFADSGDLIPRCLKVLKKGGRCICGEIHMSDIPSFPYADLWGEKMILSVANVTRKDAQEYFSKLASKKIIPSISLYPLREINQAIDSLRGGAIDGTVVILP